MEVRELQSLIRAAFADVEYPGDANIAGCSRIGCDECDPLAEHFKGTLWQQHDLQTLAGYDNAIILFNLAARHYYLPAFMLADIEANQIRNWDALPNLDVSWTVSSSDNSSIHEGHEAFVALLSTQQRRAVIEYLKYTDTFEGVYDPIEDTLAAIEFLNSDK